MANRTDPHADTVHGTNPQFLVDRIIRVKIYNDAYWKEFCFALTTETVIDRAAELDYIGGTYGGRRRPAKFLCLFLKLLQIQPDEDVVMEYIKQPDVKYLRALGCAYLRITGRPTTIYQTLEPFFADYRKLRYRDMTGKLSIIHMDEFIDMLLRDETVCDVTMPALPKREILEQSQQLDPRVSVLEDDLEDIEELEQARKEAEERKKEEEERLQVLREKAETAAAELAEEKADAFSRRRHERSRSRRARRERSASGDRAKDREREKERDSGKRPETRSKKGKDDGLSVDEWNDVRKELGLKPLRDEKKGKDKGQDKGKEKDKDKDKRSDKGPKKSKEDGLSVDEWNDVRKQLGLKPLR